MHYAVWYANFKHRMRLRHIRPVQTVKQQKLQAHKLLVALPILWLCIATLLLIFVYWSWMWMRLPLFDQQTYLSPPVLAKQTKPARLAHAYAYPNSRAWAEMPVTDMASTIAQTATQVAQRARRHKSTKLDPTLPLTVNWHLHIHKAENTQYASTELGDDATQAVENNQDCAEVEICGMSNHSDVVLLETE